MEGAFQLVRPCVGIKKISPDRGSAKWPAPAPSGRIFLTPPPALLGGFANRRECGKMFGKTGRNPVTSSNTEH